tara:strand:+ start:485 stop:1111 length:627 start_codon:yes stop_codon:yes gene_type:complete
MSHFTNYPLFPQILTTSILEVTDEQSIFLRNYMNKIDYIGVKSSPMHSFASNDRFVLNNSELLFFKDMIMHEFNNFKNSVMQLYDTTFEMTTSWFTKTPKGHSSEFHNHNNCMFSGVFYFDDSSNLVFQDFSVRSFFAHPNVYNDYNCDLYRISPEKNMITFFDSRLHHKISSNNSDMMRYSLAFNFIPIRGIHEGDSQLCFKLDLDK